LLIVVVEKSFPQVTLYQGDAGHSGSKLREKGQLLVSAARFIATIIPKRVKNIQNVPNALKLYQMAVKYSK
jgi:hypothetical protein